MWMKIEAIRLQPDRDLKISLQDFVKQHKIRAGFIITTVGSLKQASLRFADQLDTTVLPQKLEIVSLVGTLSDTRVHLHLAVADGQGKVYGGHLQIGCIIYTTAEIVIGVSEKLVFTPKLDPLTGYQELNIRHL